MGTLESRNRQTSGKQDCAAQQRKRSYAGVSAAVRAYLVEVQECFQLTAERANFILVQDDVLGQAPELCRLRIRI